MYSLNPALRDFWQSQKPYKLLKGGRASSKTHDAAGVAAFMAREYSVRFLCARQFQNRIADSVYTVIKKKIEIAGWRDEFDIGVSSIRHKLTNSEFLFYGIARNLEEIKGTEDIDVLWIEEGEGLTREQWSVIDPTVRKENAQIWILWNPRLETDFVQAELPELLGDACVIRHINYDENPFLSNDAVQKIERLKKTAPDDYRHIYKGIPLSNDDAAIIKRHWIEAAIDVDIKLGIDMSGPCMVGYDVADTGEDKNATARFHGAICDAIDEWSGDEDQLTESALRAWSAIDNHRGVLIYDSIGVGAHVGSTLKNVARGRCHPFNAGSSVRNPGRKYGDTQILNKDKFENLKAQAWRDVSDRFRRTFEAVEMGATHSPSDLICIRSDVLHLDRLKRELSTPLRAFSRRGLDMVESKEDLAKRDVKSPNLADAFIMGAYASESGYNLDNL